MNKINLLVSGAAGKMGAAVLALAKEHQRFQVVAAIDRKDNELPEVGKSGAVQAVIDFSSPQLLTEILAWAVRAKVPVVSGTTGLLDADMKKIKEAAAVIPILWAPNFSAGIQLFKNLIAEIAPFTSDYSPQLEDIHHAQKKDAPSGTAIYLQNELEKIFSKDIPKPISIRTGDVFGEHTLQLQGAEETLLIRHTALNRQVFARGALQACEWLVQKKPGLYEFSEVYTKK
jgi:4-hydroxy-tetrahydrodipicolinate reductase